MRERDEWKDAIIDAAVVNWTLSKEHETDPRAAINALLCQAQLEALDPAISEEAHALVQRAEQAEAENLKLQRMLHHEGIEHSEAQAHVMALQAEILRLWEVLEELQIKARAAVLMGAVDPVLELRDIADTALAALQPSEEPAP